MMAAGQAAQAGAEVILLERNARLGKKLAITGKGRGNLTNSAELEDFIVQFPGHGRFLYSALYRFTNEDVRRFFHEQGVPTVEERGGRIFPQSQKASDLVDAMRRFIEQAGVRIHYGHRATAVGVRNGAVQYVNCGERQFAAEAVIIATGGASYPATGSTGDGYRLAVELGHLVETPYPALVPLETAETWVRELTGLSLKNVRVHLTVGKKTVAEEFGDMLFTHYGLSGPIILTASREAVKALRKGANPVVHVNLKPALTVEQLDARILRDFNKYSRKQFKNSLGDLLPQRLIDPVIKLSKIDGELLVNQINREQRGQLLAVLTDMTFTICGVRPLKEAIVTAGGVSRKEIDSSTMASKLIKGLYFAGEVIDIDGNTGGYNLQAAFSTGALAGFSAGAQE